MLRNRLGRKRQSGMTLLEVTLAIALSAIIGTVYKSYEVIAMAEDSLAEGVGAHLLLVQQGALKYSQTKFVELSAGTAVTGVTVALTPTIAELKNIGMLSSNVRDTTVTGQPIKVSLARVGCPGVGCQVNGIVYVDGPLKVRRTGDRARHDLVSVAVSTMRGAGAASYLDDPAIIRSASGSAPNPTGSNAGIVAALTFMDMAFYNQFVRLNDTRDPNLAGNLTVAGDTAIGGQASITGSLTGSAGASFVGDLTSGNKVAVVSGGCERTSLTASGGLLIRNAACQQVATIDAAGRLQLSSGGVARAFLDPSSSSFSMLDASGVPTVSLSQVAGGGKVTAHNSAGTESASIDGATGLVRGSRMAMTAGATEGAACGPGVSDGDIVRDTGSATGTILTCRSGAWVAPGLSRVAIGAACANASQLAQTNTGASAICRGGTWVSLGDRITRQVQVGRFSVVEGSSVSKPACGVGGASTLLVTPVDTVSDYAGVPPRNRYVAYADDVGPSWTVRLRLVDSMGTTHTTSFGGAPYGLQGIATTFCDYPS